MPIPNLVFKPRGWHSLGEPRPSPVEGCSAYNYYGNELHIRDEFTITVAESVERYAPPDAIESAKCENHQRAIDLARCIESRAKARLKRFESKE